MIIINLFKVGVIWLTDLINRVYSPFKEARFQPMMELQGLEEHYSKQLEANFKSGGWFLYEKPMPADYGDEALFQGLYVAMRVLKGAEITESFSAFKTLFPNDALIRGYTADMKMNDTTSNDSATGALFALYCIWQYRGHEADDLIVRWARKVVQSGYALTDLSGKPTKYGKLVDGWKTDPLRATLLLALLALAAKIDRNEFENHYETIYDKYEEILPYAKVKLLWWDTVYDTHRAAIHLHILWQLTHDLIYKHGLRRLHSITRKETNPWVQTLCSPVLDPQNVNLTMLNTFDTVFRDRGTIQTKNSLTVDSVKWGSKVRARQPLPIWRRGSQEFYWQRNMYSLDEWTGNETAHAYHSGLDFLICYWLAKRMGLTNWVSGVKL